MKTETFEDRKTRGIKFIFIGVVLVSICIFGFIFLLTVTFVSPNQIQTPQETPTKTSNLGSIEVMSFPYGASIYLDNEYIGETPTNITNIEPGYHLITLILSGYDDWAQTFFIYGTKNISFSPTLAPISNYTEPSQNQIEEPVIEQSPTSNSTFGRTGGGLGKEFDPIIITAIASLITAIAGLITAIFGSFQVVMAYIERRQLRKTKENLQDDIKIPDNKKVV